jgi:hypothetical protein
MFLNRSSSRYRRPPRRGARLLSALAPVALAVVLVVPAAAQAEPKWFLNGKQVGSKREAVETWGSLQFASESLGKLECRMNGSGTVWNESEKGLGAMESISVRACTSGLHPCEEAGEVPSTFLTAEAPVAVIEEKAGTEKHYKAFRGKSSLPWPEELFENTEKQHQLAIRKVKLTMVIPCVGLEMPIEGSLEPTYINGSKNGLTPSRWGWAITTGGPVLPLISPQGESFGPSGEALQVGSDVQLITAK